METKTNVTTRTTTLTRADVRTAIQEGTLSIEEERYVRMRFGISEPREAALSRRGGEFPETRAQLALIEASVLAHQFPTTSSPVKDRIVERLRRI